MAENQEKIKVLFVCTGNACRSQIAEGWARHLKADTIEAFSAGVSPGYVSQRAIKTMAEAGIDISSQYSKHIDDLAGVDFDYVITLCDNARQFCPVFGGEAQVIHEPFEDPSFMPGTEEQITAAFRKLRQDIKALVEAMPENMGPLVDENAKECD